MSNLPDLFVKNVRKRQEDLRINDSQLAERMGSSRQNVSQWLNLRRVPSMESLETFANALETTVAWLLSEHPKEAAPGLMNVQLPEETLAGMDAELRMLRRLNAAQDAEIQRLQARPALSPLLEEAVNLLAPLNEKHQRELIAFLHGFVDNLAAAQKDAGKSTEAIHKKKR